MDDARTREDALRKAAIERLEALTIEEAFALAVRAGIYTPDGELTAPYRSDAGPSPHRPRD